MSYCCGQGSKVEEADIMLVIYTRKRNVPIILDGIKLSIVDQVKDLWIPSLSVFLSVLLSLFLSLCWYFN